MNKEIWKDIIGYEGLYQVSSLGRVRSLNRSILIEGKRTYFKEGKILKPLKAGAGYQYVNLWKCNHRNFVGIHRLVAKCFLPNPNNYNQVNHKDEDKTNNNVDNLEWCNAKYNMNYGNVGKKISKGVTANNGFSVPVVQFDLKWNKIGSFQSAADAERATGICASSIRKVCLNRPKFNTAGGFYWKETPDKNHSS